MRNSPMNEFPLLEPSSGVPLFYPTVPPEAIHEVADTLSGRWIGQGPKVERFEDEFRRRFLGECSALAVGSGTDALHLAYLLAEIGAGDEVICPVFTCTATNIPLLYLNAKVVFADIDPKTLNISVEDIRKRITSRTKAIVCVDYGGNPCDYDELNRICTDHGLVLIADAAHSLGSRHSGKNVGEIADFTIFSFQAIKTLTMGDGGLLAIRNKDLIAKAQRLRWFGIDRSAKQEGIWNNDILEVGYKYQMTDIGAGIGLASLKNIDSTIKRRKELLRAYVNEMLSSRVTLVPEAIPLHHDVCPWLLTLIVDKDRVGLMRKLREHGIESSQVHYRNDRYAIFGGRRSDLPMMDALEDRYLVLPLHLNMTVETVKRICNLVNSGW